MRCFGSQSSRPAWKRGVTPSVQACTHALEKVRKHKLAALGLLEGAVFPQRGALGRQVGAARLVGLLRGRKPPLCQLLQLVSGPGQLPYVVTVKPRLL